jgi:hypothetical protein
MSLPPASAQDVLGLIHLKRSQGHSAEHIVECVEIWVLETLLDRPEPEQLIGMLNE